MYIDDSMAQLEIFEEKIPWMYLDTCEPGNVTAGVGFLLETAGRALLLPWLKEDGELAPGLEVIGEFNRVKAMEPGKVAKFYKGDYCLSEDAIQTEMRKRVTVVDGVLRAGLADYDDFPTPVKLALLDMAYNLGPSGLLHGYPHLMASVDAGNWQAAEAQCYRHGPGIQRNSWTRQCFQDAYQAA